MGVLGEQAERRTEERIRAALPDGVRCHANVAFIARTRHGGPAHDGEADLVLLHPDHGLLVIEVKAGEPSRDAQGRAAGPRGTAAGVTLKLAQPRWRI